MDIPLTSNKKSCLSGCLLSVVGFILFSLMVGTGMTLRGDVSPLGVTLLAVAVAGIVLYALSSKSANHADDIKAFNEKKQAMKDIGSKYNKKVSLLQEEFKNGHDTYTRKRHYSDLYYELRTSYRKESREFSDQWNRTHLKQTKLQKNWKRAIKTAVIILACSVVINMGLMVQPKDSMAALMEERSWSADNIPMPHMKDGNLYVSNPDSILSPAVVDSINATLRLLDTKLGIESAVVIVGHIKGDDPIEMVRGIYDKYKVGRDDRGLVIVVGYLDHSYFIAPGHNLEADLTDTETHQLAKAYLIPSMKAEQPDSGMLYLARGIYAHMTQKDMPRMTALSASNNSDDGTGNIWVFALYLMAAIGILIYNSRMARRMGWAGLSYPMFMVGNPFPISPDGDNSYGYSSGGSSSHYSGGHSSGGYGGGSWGGGGSGGRW